MRKINIASLNMVEYTPGCADENIYTFLESIYLAIDINATIYCQGTEFIFEVSQVL
jgi:hypothetical protein